jgi:hypothetical protein
MNVVPCALVVLVVSSTVVADSGWLAGASVGKAKLKDFRLTTAVAEDDDTVLELYGGYKVMKHYAVTGAYVDFGSYHFEGPNFGGYVTDIEIDGFHVDNHGLLPLGKRVELRGSAGLFVWDYEENDVDLVTSDRRHLTDTGVSATFGAGVNVDILRENGIGLHFVYHRFVEVGDRRTVEHENDFDVVFAGVDYFWGK